MRVLVDTNVYLSYILASDRQGVIPAVVHACLTLDEIDLLVPPDQLVEFAGKAAAKRYFRDRIPQSAIDDFVAQLKALGELQLPPEDAAAYSRDPKDDYLIVSGVINEADYLITGDQDLLVLRQVGQLQIVTPAKFLNLLQSENLL